MALLYLQVPLHCQSRTLHPGPAQAHYPLALYDFSAVHVPASLSRVGRILRNMQADSVEHVTACAEL